MNICSFSKLCNFHEIIEVKDYYSRERLYYGLNVNVPNHKKWIVKYIYINEQSLVICIKDMNKVNN